MKLYFKIIGLIVVLIIIVSSIYTFIDDIKSASLPPEFNEFESIEVMDTIKIYQNNYGIPHIIANSEYDAYFSIGYFHAQERLWQMDYLRRAAYGKLSEILGNDALQTDKFMRTLEISNLARSNYKILSKKSKSILEAYCKGVNSFIEKNKGRMQFEFGALDYFPSIWTPEDCMAISKLFAFEMSLSFYFDLTFGEIANRIGNDYASKFIPQYPNNAACVLDNKINFVPTADTNKPNATASLSFNDGLLEDIQKVREFLGFSGSSIGSNVWAMKKKHGNYSTIFANDPHLSFGLPAKWVQMHVSSSNFNIIGNTMPGLPLFMTGRNDYIAWGVTNMMLDDCDFFIEKIDPSGKYYYQSDSSKKLITYIADTIKIKNNQDYIYYFRKTERSPIISDAHYFNNANNKYFKSNAITYRWTARENADNILAIYKINTAKNWNDFVHAAEMWSAPALNFTFADKYGNIGVAPCGYIPKRNLGNNPNFPNSGSNTDWYGYYTGKDMPKQLNPEKGFVASANNKTLRESPFYLSSHWEPSSRIERIEEMLMVSENYEVRDAQYMQNDYLSPYAREMMKKLMPIFYKYEHLLNGKERTSFAILKKWDFIMTPGSQAASIYNVFLNKLINNTFEDELGNRLLKNYTMISNLSLRKIMELCDEPDNILFDNVKTPDREHRDYTVIKSFKDAIAELDSYFKGDYPQRWYYGKLHTLTLNHILSSNSFIKPTVTISGIEIGGNSTTLNNTEYRINDSYKAIIGSSVRFITDMGDNYVYTSMPGGISGDPMSQNYSNQVQLWLNGGYIKIPCKKTPSGEFILRTLINPE